MLRGINVSGKNILKMSDLKQMCQSLGYKNVSTYIQSGNIIFQTDECSLNILETTISKEILKIFFMNVPVIVIEKSMLKPILEQNPFLKKRNKDAEKLYICFLSNLPDNQLLKKIEPTSYLPDEYIIAEKMIYIFCQNGYGNTKLNNNFFENKLKLNATTRNLKTLTELIKICDTF